jgi:hypothetical protein
MNPVELAIGVGGLTILLVEFIKWVVRKYIVKDPEYSLPPVFYMVGVPVSNALMPFVAVYLLGLPMTDPILGMGVVGVIQYVLRVGIASLLSFLGYNDVLKPLNDYRKAVKESKAVQPVGEVTDKPS